MPPRREAVLVWLPAAHSEFLESMRASSLVGSSRSTTRTVERSVEHYWLLSPTTLERLEAIASEWTADSQQNVTMAKRILRRTQ